MCPFCVWYQFLLPYWQCYHGISIGTPFENAFLCHYKKQWLSNCPPDFQPQIFRQYVDIFVIFTSQTQHKSFVNYMNKQHANIKFTFEVEQSNRFSLLDTKICCETNKFTTSVYRKCTFSGVCTNFASFIRLSCTFGLVNMLLFHCFTLCGYLKDIFK